MRIRAGCELSFEFSQTMPMIVTLTVHFSRFSDLERPDHLMTNPSVPIEGYRDSFGNWCSRLVAPAGPAPPVEGVASTPWYQRYARPGAIGLDRRAQSADRRHHARRRNGHK